MFINELLYGKMPGHLIPLVPKRFEVIGDIAVIVIPDALLEYQEVIAEAVIAHRRNVKTVLQKVSKREGKNRVARYEPIIGFSTSTTCRESGFRYNVDLTRAFFTSRLSGERMRINNLVQTDERVFIPFAGVGPFVIPAAAKGAQVTALEINPQSCRMLIKNMHLNHLNSKISIIQGDAMCSDKLFRSQFERAIIPTPYGLDSAFDTVQCTVKPGGHIHFFTFKNQKQAALLEKIFEQKGFFVERSHRCGNVAPSVSRWVYDLIKSHD